MFELLFSHPLWAYRNGSFALASGWPRWWLVVAIALGGVAIAVGLWRRRELGWWRVSVLAGLQVAMLALLLTLLWRPVLNVERVRDRQNQLAVALDTSGSMAGSDASGDTSAPTRLQQALASLNAGPLDELRKTFDVRMFGFAGDLRAWSEVEPRFESAEGAIAAQPVEVAGNAQTRIGDALLRILKTAGSAPLAAVVLVSDGAENGASLSEERLHELASYGVPIHTVGVGSERIDNDLELTDVRVAQTAAQDSTVTAEATVHASHAGKTKLRVYDRGELIAARDVSVDDRTELTTVNVEFPAGAAGVHDLKFALDALPDEKPLVNNERHTVLTVPETRRSVLYLEGEPRWEFKFIRRALERERGLRLVSVVRTTPNKFYRQGVRSADELSEGFPSQQEELFGYDALILGSLEATSLSPAQHQWLQQFVDVRGGGVLMLAGRYGLGAGGWRNAALAQALPTALPDKTGELVRESLQAVLTDYGKASPSMRLDADVRRNAELWQSLPPLANYQALGRLKPGAIVLLEGQASKERFPLLVWQRYGRGSTYLLGTASTQRWQMSLPPEDQRHETFWRQLLHALADSSPQRVSLNAERSVYDDERRVMLDAEVRDAKFAPISQARVEVLVTPEHGDAYTQVLRPSGNEDGRYVGSIDARDVGLYRIDLRAESAGTGSNKADYGTATTFVRREDGVIEHFGREQHRAVLERIAAMTGGRYWTLADLSQLTAAIPYSKAGIVERQVLDLWHIPFVFLLLLALKCGEWALRLKWGRL